jgi:hypothetical protein
LLKLASIRVTIVHNLQLETSFAPGDEERMGS